MLDRLDRDGYSIRPALIEPNNIACLIDAFGGADMARSERRGETFGARNILAMSEVRSVIDQPILRSVVKKIVGNEFRAVRGLFFDKTESANWPVPWHQDLTVALAARADVEGWGAWSIKAGTVHAQPPARILERTLTVRIHLDDCGEGNGPLRVLPGTHRFGRLVRERIIAFQREVPETICVADAGSALFMRPLLLHASSAARSAHHRRVLHLEFAPDGILPDGMAWAA